MFDNFLYIIFISMFETTSEAPSIKEHKPSTPQIEAVNLPIIIKKPIQQASLTQNKQFSRKQNLGLPSIKSDSQPVIPEANSIPIQNNQKQNYQNKSEFMIEVQQKLKLVLGDLKEHQNNKIQDGNESQDDFQAKIIQNKEILKEHRKKKQNEDVTNKAVINQKVEKRMPPKFKFSNSKNRNESLYEKRVKDYKNHFTQNKTLSKKKQAIIIHKEKVSTPEQVHNIPPHNQKIIKQSRSKKNHPRIMSQKSSTANLNEINKSINLFDNIQNYLQNPHQFSSSSLDKNKNSSQKQLVGLAIKRAKRSYQDQLKIIQEKLGGREGNSLLEKEQMNGVKNIDVGDWRKVRISEKQINCQVSTFEKQIQRINSLQQKNSLSLEKYLDHQKILVQMLYQRQIHKKYERNSH